MHVKITTSGSRRYSSLWSPTGIMPERSKSVPSPLWGVNVQPTHPCGLAPIRVMRFFSSSTARVRGAAYWARWGVFRARHRDIAQPHLLNIAPVLLFLSLTRPHYSWLGLWKLAQQTAPRTPAVELEKSRITLIGANPQGWIR